MKWLFLLASLVLFEQGQARHADPVPDPEEPEFLDYDPDFDPEKVDLEFDLYGDGDTTYAAHPVSWKVAFADKPKYNFPRSREMELSEERADALDTYNNLDCTDQEVGSR